MLLVDTSRSKILLFLQVLKAMEMQDAVDVELANRASPSSATSDWYSEQLSKLAWLAWLARLGIGVASWV